MSIGVWLYTANYDFVGGNKLEQNPIGTIKLHGIKSFKKGIWAALGAAYAYGGRVFVNGEKRNTIISAMRLGVIVAIPLHPQHSLKLTALTAMRFKEGADFDSFGLAYQFLWN